MGIGMITNKGCCDSCGPITVNAEVVGEAKRFQYDGRDTMSVPVVAIVEGVLNGALVPAEEFSAYTASWEGVVVPVDHPQLNGIHVSANLPQVKERRVIGHFQNVKAEGNKLKGEIWLDVNRAIDKGFGEIITKFENNELMEVSTAYFSDTEPTSGVFNGKEYNGIHRNLRPDHLALLPNATGACSIQDGCGAMRANEDQGIIMSALSKIRELFAMPSLGIETNEESLSDKVRLVRQEVDKLDYENNVHFVVEVYDNSVVYEVNGKMYSREYQIAENGSVAFTGAPTEVRMEKTFTPIANESDAQASDDQPDNGDNPETNEDANMSENQEAQAPQLDAESQLAVNWAREQYAKRKGELISKIKTNKSNAFTDEQLDAMDVNTLEPLAATLAPRDYSGRGAPVTHTAGDTAEEALEMPVFTLGGDK